MATPGSTGGGGDPSTPLGFRRLQLRGMKVETFEEATLPLLQTAVNDWLEGRGEETFIDVLWNHDHPAFSVLIFYTEE